METMERIDMSSPGARQIDRPDPPASFGYFNEPKELGYLHKSKKSFAAPSGHGKAQGGTGNA